MLRRCQVLGAFAKTKVIIGAFPTCVQESSSALGGVPTKIIDVISNEVQQRVYDDVFPSWGDDYRCCTTSWPDLHKVLKRQGLGYPEMLRHELDHFEQKHRHAGITEGGSRKSREHKQASFSVNFKWSSLQKAQIFANTFGLHICFNLFRRYDHSPLTWSVSSENPWWKETHR